MSCPDIDILLIKYLTEPCALSHVNSYPLTRNMQPCNKISPFQQMQMEIQLHHPLQIIQKKTVTEKEIQQQDQEVCVSLRSLLNAEFVMHQSICKRLQPAYQGP